MRVPTCIGRAPRAEVFPSLFSELSLDPQTLDLVRLCDCLDAALLRRINSEEDFLDDIDEFRLEPVHKAPEEPECAPWRARSFTLELCPPPAKDHPSPCPLLVPSRSRLSRPFSLPLTPLPYGFQARKDFLRAAELPYREAPNKTWEESAPVQSTAMSSEGPAN